jgi:hypothetical protein
MIFKTKLISILKTFSKGELVKFKSFAGSYYESSDGKILRLLDEVIKYYPEFENKSITKKQLFAVIYPKQRYNDATIRKLISYLTKLAEEYLIHQNVKRDNFAKDLHLLKELSFRNADNLFEQQARLTEKKIKKYPHDAAFYYNRFKLLNAINSYYAIRKRSKAVDNYQREADSFFHFFFVEALNIYMYLINEKTISNREFNLILFNEVTTHLRDNSYTEVSSIPVYYNCLMVLLTEDEKYYRALREIQKSLDYKIQSNELEISYIVLQNYYVAKVKKGITKYRQDAFELQKEVISRGFHLSGDRIHIFTFLNIVSEAVSMGETNWAEVFIKENRKLLEPEYEFDAVSLSYAKCEFSRREYEKALTRLGKINMEYSHFKLSVRTLMLMIYYELGSFDPAISMLDSYKHFITRDKMLPKVDMQNRIEFAKHFKEIINLKTGMSNDIDSVKMSIESTGSFAEKQWVLEKLNELI